MAKGKENAKAAVKKRERIALQRKMDARISIVKAANEQADPLASLPSFKVSGDQLFRVVFVCRIHKFFFTVFRKEWVRSHFVYSSSDSVG